MVGEVIGIEDAGTIVSLTLQVGNSIRQVHMDHTPFRWMYEAEDGNVIGRTIEVEGMFDEERIEFLD